MRKDSSFLLIGWAVSLAGLLLLGLTLWAYAVLSAPSALRIASGPEDGFYAAVAETYAAQLRAQGVEVAVVNTLGTVENLALLRAARVDLAIVQGGLAGLALPPGQRAADARLVSLGSVFHEPVWVFVRADSAPLDRRHLQGRRIAIGPEGSGTRALALALLEANSMDVTDTELLPLTGMAAAHALLAGRIDAAIYVAARPGAAVSLLLRSPETVRLLDFSARAEAYATVLPYLTPVRLARSGFSLAEDLPAEGVTMMAPAAYVAARDTLDPQVAALIAGVLRQASAGRQMFAAAGQFPSLLNQDLPMQPDARRYIERGPPLLQSWLPFRWAVLLDRLAVLGLPLLTIGLPLLRFAPPAWRWQMERRIWRRYGDLLRIEGRLLRDGIPAGAEREALLARLAALDRQVVAMGIPRNFGRHLYALRRDIEFLRRRVTGEPPAAE